MSFSFDTTERTATSATTPISLRPFAIGLLVIAKAVDIFSTYVGLKLGAPELNPVVSASFEAIGLIPTLLTLGLVAVLGIVIVSEWTARFLRRHGYDPFVAEAIRAVPYFIMSLVWLGVGLRNLRIIMLSVEVLP